MANRLEFYKIQSAYLLHHIKRVQLQQIKQARAENWFPQTNLKHNFKHREIWNSVCIDNVLKQDNCISEND